MCSKIDAMCSKIDAMCVIFQHFFCSCQEKYSCAARKIFLDAIHIYYNWFGGVSRFWLTPLNYVFLFFDWFFLSGGGGSHYDTPTGVHCSMSKFSDILYFKFLGLCPKPYKGLVPWPVFSLAVRQGKQRCCSPWEKCLVFWECQLLILAFGSGIVDTH